MDVRKLLAAVCAAAAVIGAPGPAAPQSAGRVPAPAATGSIPMQPATPPPPWSGQPGSSGHPLMTTEAILAAAANFGNCLESLWPDAVRRGVTRATFEAATRGLTPDLRIMDLMDAQPEFTKAFWDYLDLLVSDARIKRGGEILAQYRPIFDAVEKTYGVDRHIVTAIWGIESNFGTSVGERPVIRSTATLACVGRRQGYFRDEFLAALEIINRGDIGLDRLKGSWAGAFGPTQFMPTSFKRYAVDFDGDGRRDVVDSVPDLIASTANNLKTDGWMPGQTWGYEVTLPAGFNYLLADGAKSMPVREWERLGVVRIGGKAYPRPGDRAYLLIPAGANGPSFLMLNNFRVLMKYNPAEAYALAIGHLADRMRGDGPIVTPWPRQERVLTSTERYELQQQLIRHGFDIGGEPNGRINVRSRNAIKRFQVSEGLIPDGFASAEMLERLRGP
jgi:membrane-bound lytic murein transglycosylase B